MSSRSGFAELLAKLEKAREIEGAKALDDHHFLHMFPIMLHIIAIYHIFAIQ